MNELTWDNLWVAAEAGNHAYSPLETLGRVSVLLEQDMRAGTNNDPHNNGRFNGDAELARKALATVERILANRRRRNGGSVGDDQVEVAKATEAVLDRSVGLFRRNSWHEPYDVLAECRFHEAAKAVCADNGCYPPFPARSRFSDKQMDAEEARRVIQSDRERRSAFEQMSHEEWLSRSEHERSHRVAWQPAAELWARMALRMDEEIPSDPPRLPAGAESLVLALG